MLNKLHVGSVIVGFCSGVVWLGGIVMGIRYTEKQVPKLTPHKASSLVRLPTLPTNRAAWRGVTFASSSDGKLDVLGVDGKFFKTADNGLTWIEIYPIKW